MNFISKIVFKNLLTPRMVYGYYPYKTKERFHSIKWEKIRQYLQITYNPKTVGQFKYMLRVIYIVLKINQQNKARQVIMRRPGD